MHQCSDNANTEAVTSIVLGFHDEVWETICRLVGSIYNDREKAVRISCRLTSLRKVLTSFIFYEIQVFRPCVNDRPGLDLITSHMTQFLRKNSQSEHFEKRFTLLALI